MSVDIRVGNISKDSVLGDYYMDFSNSIRQVEDGLYGPLDNLGVPLVDYDLLFLNSRIANKKNNYGIHYTPVTIAQYGLGLYSNFLKARTSDYSRLIKAQADWFVNNISITSSNFGVWLHPFEFPIYDLEPPWVSAMAQGQGISLLLRAYQMTHEHRYLETSKQAFRAFKYDISEGGVSATDSQGHLWLEEYPTKPPTHVLNGFIFALWGVLDYYRITNDHSAYDVYERCIETLKNNLPRYEWYYWSRYDLLHKGNASADYHKIHVVQLQVLSRLLEEPIFVQYASRWKDYSTGKCRMRRFITTKVQSLMRRAGLLSQLAFQGISSPPVNRFDRQKQM